MGDVELFSDIPYGKDELNKLDVLLPRAHGSNNKPLICFIHGGAWRSWVSSALHLWKFDLLHDSGDKAEHVGLATRLATLTGCTIALLNYRLTPRAPSPETLLYHPAHARDVLDGLELLVSCGSGEEWRRYDRGSFFIIGHSCGAHILTTIFLDTTSTTPSLTPSPSLLAATKSIALVEGILDLELLYKLYPDYRGFLSNAFGSSQSLKCVSSNNFPLRAGAEHIVWFIVHSTGDELVDDAQPKSIYNHLINLYGRDTQMVFKDFTSMTEGHDRVLRTEEFAKLIGNFVISKVI